MTSKPRKMNMGVGQGAALDVDALIAGADPMKSSKPKTASTKSTKPKTAPKSKKGPWEDKATTGRVNMPLYVTPQIKAMLDYLQQETGIPRQVTLRKIIEPELKKICNATFKGKS